MLIKQKIIGFKPELLEKHFMRKPIEIYDDLANHYTSEIKPKITTENTGLPKFLDNLLEQIEVMLTCICS